MRDQLKSSECSRYLKALADPDRLKIIQCLQGGPKHVGELTKLLDKPIANVSHHLGLLRVAGIVTSTKSGRFVTYTLAPALSAIASNPPTTCSNLAAAGWNWARNNGQSFCFVAPSSRAISLSN